MFKILDGRSEFYQWDLNRTLEIEDSSITEVHFCNRTDDCSLVCETFKIGTRLLVSVPNILLQDAWRINVYAYDKNYTKHSASFRVVPRTKPSDYVYTETEILSFKSLDARLDKLEEEGLGGIIDGVVTSVNGKTGDVSITPASIGALPDSTPIPDITGLATEKYVTQSLQGYLQQTDLEGLATEKYVQQAISDADIDVNLDGYATEQYVDDAIANIDIPEGAGVEEIYVGTTDPGADSDALLWMNPEGTDDSDLATEAYVDQKIAEAQIGGSGSADLTNYYTKTETDSAIDEAIGAIEIPEVDLSDYALKSEIPSTTGLATEEFVTQKISEAQLDGGDVDLSAYYTKSETDAAIEAAKPDLSGYALKTELPSTTGLATETYVDEKIAAIPKVDLTGYALKTDIPDVSGYALKTDIPNLNGYYTKAEIDALLENLPSGEAAPSGEEVEY